MDTRTLQPDPDGLATAADLLRAGELVAFPTETVYGLGAIATNGTAVAGIFAAKGRPSFNPLIVHVASQAAAETLAEWSGDADRLARAFWPGPLTLVLPLAAESGLSPLVTAGLPSVAVRVPQHPTAQALLAAVGAPVAAPSANPSGRISPTTAAHVLRRPWGPHRRSAGWWPLPRRSREHHRRAHRHGRACCAPAGCRPRRSSPRWADPC